MVKSSTTIAELSSHVEEPQRRQTFSRRTSLLESEDQTNARPVHIFVDADPHQTSSETFRKCAIDARNLRLANMTRLVDLEEELGLGIITIGERGTHAEKQQMASDL